MIGRSRVARLARGFRGVRAARTLPPDFTSYKDDPIRFAREVLKVTPTPDQEAIAPTLLNPPFKTIVRAGHNVGKTWLMAWLGVWWFYTRPASVVITTAPTQRDVVDLLWTEIRLMVRRAGLPEFFIGPAAPEMRTGEEHWAKGYTASKGESFQGRHRSDMLFLFDEAEGLSDTYWQTTKTMFKPGDGHGWLAILNPTTTTSPAYREEKLTLPNGDRAWTVVTLSCLTHPNVSAELRGLPPPVPNAISVAQLETEMFPSYAEVIPAGQERATDVEFPPGSGRWWRPGPVGEARILGRRPSVGIRGVWSEALWEAAAVRGPGAGRPHLAWGPGDLPQIGCDVARDGDDWTAIHVRCGPVSLHHESANGWKWPETARRLRELAREWAGWATALRPPQAAPVDPKAIRIKVDDTGYGGALTDALAPEGWAVVPVNAGERAVDDEHYPRVRDELWFLTADRAFQGRLDLSRLPRSALARLENQATAPTFDTLPDGRRRVEEKRKTKDRIGRSPDDVDSMNLAYYDVGSAEVATWVETPKDHRTWRERRR